MHKVTWRFKGTKQAYVCGDILAAERKARELKRLGCKKVKIDSEKTVVQKIIVDEWPQIEEALSIATESEDMCDDIEDAKQHASELWQRGVHTKSEIVQILNNKYEPTFFATKDGIYAKNEPDYLPDRKVLSC